MDVQPLQHSRLVPPSNVLLTAEGRSALWNADLCAAVLERHGHHPVSRAQHVNQWTDLLEAMADGSPSITTSADQMAEELPSDLVDAVNQQLNRRGCPYQVHQASQASLRPQPACELFPAAP